MIQIGSTTCGKPYGFYDFDNCGTTYFSIQFRGVNAKNFGDYTDGFSPQNSTGSARVRCIPGCSVADDFSHALGDPNEGRLRCGAELSGGAELRGPATGMVKAFAVGDPASGRHRAEDAVAREPDPASLRRAARWCRRCCRRRPVGSALALLSGESGNAACCDLAVMARIRIGISGWRYAPWRGSFYPKDLPQKDELRYAASIFPTIEINGSFYSLQRPESYAQWYAQTPKDFVFAVKGGRYITHMKKLRDVKAPLANFLASGLFNLREKLGPILWQFPPSFRYDEERVATFLELLPQDTGSALRLARKRDAWLKGRTRLAIDRERPLRHAFEIRHESFCDPSFMRAASRSTTCRSSSRRRRAACRCSKT